MSKWTTIPDFSNYEVSSKGEVRSKPRTVEYTSPRTAGKIKRKYEGQLITPIKSSSDNHYRVMLVDDWGKHRFVDVGRLVANAYVPKPKGAKSVLYKDGDRTNVSASNLDWNLSSHSKAKPLADLNSNTYYSSIMECSRKTKISADTIIKYANIGEEIRGYRFTWK